MENVIGTFEIHKLDEGYKVKVYTEDGTYKVAEEKDPAYAVAKGVIELSKKQKIRENNEIRIKDLEEELAALKGE